MSGVTSDKEQAYLFDENVTRIWLRNQGISTFDLESLIPLSNLRELYLDNNELETLNLEPLAKHGGLQVLSLAENRLSSVDLAPLSRCKNLTWLSLSKNKLDTIDLSPLAGCESLENLYLGGNNFTSVNLKPLARCRSLTEIVLSSDINDSLDTIIDLTHLVPLKNLQKVGLYKLERVSLGLQAHQFKRVPQAVTQCLEKCRNVSIEDIVKSRIDLMGPRKGLESLEQEIDRIDSQHWLDVRRDIFRPLGLDVIAGFDGQLSELAPNKRMKKWKENVIVKATKEIAKGSRSILLNLEELDMKNGIHANLHSAILENRINESKQAQIYVCEGCADLREIWYSAWGFKLLSKRRTWIFSTTGKPLIDLRNSIRNLGFDLVFVPVKIRDPWPSISNEPSSLLIRAILGSADRTASEAVKKRALSCILKSALHPLRGEYERIVTHLNERREQT